MKKILHAGLRRTLWMSALVFALAFATGRVAVAMDPPEPGMIEEYKKDGSFAERLRRARAMGNNKMDPALGRMLQYKLARMTGGAAGRTAMKPPPKDVGLPTTGTVKILVVCIRFNDYINYNPIETIQGGLFGTGKSRNYPAESLNSFYKRSSYNQLNITGDVLGWTDTYIKRDAFVTGTTDTQEATNREKLIEQVLNYWDTQGVDFTQYDNDKDGKIDYFIVLWTGPHNGWSNFWWAYQTSWVMDPNYTIDGETLGTYVWMPESMYPKAGAPKEFEPSTVIHETGHALGLPDYYDYNGDVGPMGGVGGIDVMDDNWGGDHNAFSKFVLDWITPTVYSAGDNTITLRQSNDYQDAALIMPEALPGYPYGEFFIAQNRNKQGNDSYQPGKGLLIWHVDSRLTNTGQEFEYDNSYTSHKLLRLMEADGLEEIEQDRYAEAGDYYRTGFTLSPSTTPNSKRYNGTSTGITIDNIGPPDVSVTFQAHIANFAAVRATVVDDKSLSHVDVEFNRAVNAVTATAVGNYSVGNGIGTPASAAVQADGKTVRITTSAMSPYSQYPLTITSAVTDSEGDALYTGNLPLIISTVPTAPCYSSQRCVTISSCDDFTSSTGCSPLKRLNSSGGYPSAHGGYAKGAVEGVGVYLLDSNNIVTGTPALTDAGGNFTMFLDTYITPVSLAGKYKVVLKIPAAQSAGVACSNPALPLSFYGADCAVIAGTNLTLKQDGSTVKVYLPLIADATGGGAPNGNANCDGVINMADFSILKANFNKNVGAGGAAYADFNADGVVNMMDFTILKANFNKTLATAPAFDANMCKP